MQLKELRTLIASLDATTKWLADEATLIERDAYLNFTHFYRPVGDDVLLTTGVRSPEHFDEDQIKTDDIEKQIDHALAALDLASSLALDPAKPLLKAAGLKSPASPMAHVAIMAPQVFLFYGKPFEKKLEAVTYNVIGIYDCECTGDETVPEAMGRYKDIPSLDLDRDPVPVVVGRYKKQTGPMAKKFGDAKYARIVELLEELPRDGGTVEFKNYEHAHAIVAGERDAELVELTFEGTTSTHPVADVIQVFHELVYHGREAALKARG